MDRGEGALPADGANGITEFPWLLIADDAPTLTKRKRNSSSEMQGLWSPAKCSSAAVLAEFQAMDRYT